MECRKKQRHESRRELLGKRNGIEGRRMMDKRG
jgi:hypothetical protein